MTPTENNTMEEVDHTKINVVTVQLPSFSPNKPLTWFRRAERHFHFKRITVSTTKTDYPSPPGICLSTYLTMVRHAVRRYHEDLKAMLLKKLRPTSSVRAQRIRDLSQQHILHEIFTLLQLPDINEDTGFHKQFDLLKEILLMCLIPEVRSTVAEIDTCDTSKLVEEAERRHNAYIAATHLRPSTLPTSDITAVHQRPTLPAQPTRPTQPTPPAQPTPPTEPFICWYNLRYDDRSTKCIEGCEYRSKNLSGGRAYPPQPPHMKKK